MAKNKKHRFKNSKATIAVFWVCLVLILLPFLILGYILLSSSQDTHTPVKGNRYQGDLDPAITEEKMNEVKESVGKIEGVQSADVEMQTATLRVYMDMNDDADAGTLQAKTDEAYNAVAGILDPSVYFTKTDDKKMYDLEIHAYTIPERTGAEGENFVYVIKTKTSSMSDPQTQVVSEPVNAELDQSWRDEVETRKAEEEAQAQATPTPDGGEITGGEDVPQDTQGEAQGADNQDAAQ